MLPKKTGWEEISSDSDDSMIILFHYLHGRDGRYDDTDVRLDTGSTYLVIKNRKMIRNITNSKKHSGHLRTEDIRAQARRGNSRDFFKFGTIPNQC